MVLQSQKTRQLLAFLKDFATLRRKRIPAYGTGDKVLWLADLPRDLPQIRSAFIVDNAAEMADLWLEVRKKRMPIRPPVPEVVKDWVRPQDFDQTDREPDLLPEITVIVEKQVPDPDTPEDQGRTVIEKVPEVRRLVDHPEIEDAWLEYLINQWEPWAQEMRRWREVQRFYEDVDFMRRRLEEAEERYELVLAVGLLQWRDPNGVAVKRHLLTAPAEISLDAARGVLTVGPAASFQGFRIELDMLELQHQPHLEPVKEKLHELLEELDVQAWDRTKVAEILRVIANRASPDAQVDEDEWKPADWVDDTLRIVYAPALVLRERRPTAYDELMRRFLEAAESESSLATTEPWERFISEGESLGDPVDAVPADLSGSSNVDERLYFPLPTNEEQRKIAEHLRRRPNVLVKGPPGTGKSHTIANLICHLLALGERVLVTAHAPKALVVLRELLPGDIRNLCVTAFGSTRDDQRLLEDSVRGILFRRSKWNGSHWAQQEILRLERELLKLEGECAEIDRRLRECREAETHSHTLFRGYQGTAAQIARQLERDRDAYEWFPDVADPDSRCPLETTDLVFLAEVHASLTEEQLNELSLNVGDFQLPDPQTFREAITALASAEQKARVYCKSADQEELDRLQHFPDSALESCRAFLSDLEAQAVRASRVLKNLTSEILKDLLAGQDTRWQKLAQSIASLLQSIQAARERLAAARVELPKEVENLKLLEDARRRLEYFRKGGHRGFWIFTPRVVRETRYVDELCRVDGQMPREPRSLEALVTFLELKMLLEQFSEAWPEATDLINQPDPRRAAQTATELAHELVRLLKLFGDYGPDALVVVPVGKRVMLAEPDERHKWLALLEAELARREAEQAKEPLDTWLSNIRSVPKDSSHPCMHELARAIEERDVTKWKTAWESRESLKEQKARLGRYQELIDQLEKACSGLKSLLNSTRGVPEWKDRLVQLDRAWAWSAAQAWLHQVTNSNDYKTLIEQRHRLQSKVEETTLKLVELKAWKAFFDRLDDATEQNLIAWTKAVARIGKGTGKYAYRHRRTARQYLMACIPKIPAWIMPLHKLWDTVTPEPGLFDTVIIDEASQAGIDSLILLLLAKRIVVVGDDKQNSPEAVGVLEDDIARLARSHLRDFRFLEEFRPDTSLYDHAERAFGNVISLREHFRCVPEIIRFSNDLCYTDAPLIPLRQPPPNPLPPLVTTFVPDGYCEGDGQRLINRAEADKIVQTIQECLENETYEGKTMGVIVLQGHAQAELIEKKLAEVLEPKVREERKLRCGVPATFQGDQRDVVFLSLVVAPNHRYRALTTLDDQRRFNVAMSRARDQVWLLHSVQQQDLSREDLRWRLLSFFNGSRQSPEIYEDLDRLERDVKHTPRRPGEQPDPYESWFEVDVALELVRRKYKVRPQYCEQLGIRPSGL